MISVAELVKELGYDSLGPASAPPHKEMLQLNGDVNLNPEREQLSFNLKAARQGDGGTSGIKGSGDLQFANYEITLDIESLELASLVSESCPWQIRRGAIW